MAEIADTGADVGALRRRLSEIASDFAFTWLPEARDLFARLDRDLFARLGHGPSALLAELGDEALGAAADGALLSAVDRVSRALEQERSDPGRWQEAHLDANGFLVAYFSMEFGLDESLPIYSGGLGVLAGDHLKSASELGLPLVGVGLFYREGYFRQELGPDGGQAERYRRNDPARLGLELVPAQVEVELADDAGVPRPLRVAIWRARVGRVELFLLDSDVEGNSDWARAICDRLYGGDREHRLRQELVLGVGGVRALDALGLRPSVWHLNEGHSAFLVLERMRALVGRGMSPAHALERVRASTVFTTHTPVPAGNEVFELALLGEQLERLVAECGLGWEDFLALGRTDEGEAEFGMTPFALRCSRRANAVSALHGEVARAMWQPLWPKRTPDEVPIGHVTNGVHAGSWLGAGLADALRRHGVRLDGSQSKPWDGVLAVDDGELWHLHQERKLALLELLREREGVTLAPAALTIGFARRFATYKRAGLVFGDPDRLARLIGDSVRPVQILFAGKAHPADGDGKELIRQVVEFAHDPRFGGRVVFVPDYELTLARYLVQGADVWLNTPRRPQEASGTSGMKAAINGVLNCSVPDGWWAEAYAPELGFAVEARAAADDETQDDADAAALYAVLEQEVVPAFYERDETGLPLRWLAMMRRSIAELGEQFSSGRMVREYAERYYLPAHRASGT